VIVYLLVWALLVTSADIAHILWPDDGASPVVSPVPANGAAPVSGVAPPSTVEAPGATPPPQSPPAVPGTGRAAANVAPPASFPTTTEPTIPPRPTVVCESDLALEESPNAPFNFLCLQDGAPITWPSNHLTLFAAGLSPQQQSGLQIALVEFQQASGFSVTRVNAPSADVVMKVAQLTNGEGGHATVHYVCTTTCAFDHAEVVLSADRLVTDGLWVTTMLHELGHVAGLNHVARSSQVMYPEITVSTPVAYASGDRDGFDRLAALRAA
jgi:hypothetical protein